VLALLVSGVVVWYGTWLTRHAGEEASRKQNEQAGRIQREQKEENARALDALRQQDEKTVRELREERETILVALNAARRDDSKRITEEKIRVIQSDFSQWAENFATNLPAKRRE